MLHRFDRFTMASAGLLAGVIAGILTLTVPSLIDQLGIPMGALTGLFIGDIFGAVISVYLYIVLGRKSIWVWLGLIFCSTIAYIAAMFTTMFSAAIIGFTQVNREYTKLESSPVLAFAIGGSVGAFLVLFTALTLCSDRHKLFRILLSSLQWSPVGGVLAALGWAAGPLVLDVVGRRTSLNDDTAYGFSIHFVWQAGIGLVLGLVFSAERADIAAPNEGSLHAKTRRLGHLQVARVSLLVLASVLVGFLAFRSLPDQYKSARWTRAYNQHVADTPSLDNLPELQPLPPDQVLILRQFGDYVPGRTSSGKTHPPVDAKTLTLRAPAAQAYSVRYALPGAPTDGPIVGPHVDVQVLDYPTALWAGHEVVDQGFGIDLGNPARPVKFGYRLYGQARSAANGEDGFYIWASDNRIIIMQFFAAEADEIMKAYLEKFPPASTDHI